MKTELELSEIFWKNPEYNERMSFAAFKKLADILSESTRLVETEIKIGDIIGRTTIADRIVFAQHDSLFTVKINNGRIEPLIMDEFDVIIGNVSQLESPRPVKDGKPYWVIERKCEHCFEWYNELDKNWYNDIHKATKFEKQEYAGHVFVLKAGIGLEHSYVAEHNGTSNGWQYEKCRIK